MSDPSKNKKEVSDGLKTLAYDPKEILVFKGDTTVSFIPKESRKENDGRYIVIERRQREITESNVDIGMVESIVGRTYPGSLLLANSRLMDNQPDVLSVNRNPIRLRVDLPGMKNDGSIIVEDPGYENVSGSINEVLDIWNEKYAKDHSITARVQYNESMAYSQSQLRAKFGMEITHLANKLNIDFEAVYKKETSVFIAAFKQIFYVVSAELPKDPADVFAPEVTWGELEQKNVNAKNPPAMVAMVGYGRTIFVKMESNSTDTNVEAAFKAVAKDVKASADVKYSEILKNTTFTAYVLGGGAGEHIKIIDAKDMGAVRKVITENAEYSRKNPGYPIFYSSVFLKDNCMATVNSVAKYVETSCREYRKGIIALKHTGGYVAQFKVTWDEVTFDPQGQPKIENKSWAKNMKDLTAPFNTEIELPGNSKNICVFARECTFLAWEWWRTVFSVKDVSLIPKRAFHISGTTLNQKYSIDPGI